MGKDYTYDVPNIDKKKLKRKYTKLTNENIKLDKLKINLTITKNLNLSSYPNIVNFLKYRICGPFGINVYAINFDYDKLPDVKSEIENYIKSKVRDEIELTKDGLKIKNIEYTIDTANSVQTLLGFYMRCIHDNNWYGKDKKNNVSRDYEFLTKILDNKIEKDTVLEKFDELISLYHTSGNFVLVPKGFNQEKNRKFKDFHDKALNYLNESNLEWNGKKYYNDIDIFNLFTGYNIIKQNNLNMGNGIINKLNSRKKISNNEIQKYKILLIDSLNDMIVFIEKRNRIIDELIIDEMSVDKY